MDTCGLCALPCGYCLKASMTAARSAHPVDTAYAGMTAARSARHVDTALKPV